MNSTRRYDFTYFVVACALFAPALACDPIGVLGKDDGEGETEGDPIACEEDACGPAPGAPNFECEDGTIGGPGPCIQLDDGSCGWEWIECPPADDDDDGGQACECEDEPPEWLCPNDMDHVCGDRPDGSCGWVCPDDGCTAEECGPAPGEPNWECSDGTVGGPACVQADDGACGWISVECPPGTCSPDDCTDPPPEVPQIACADGTPVTFECTPLDDGSCGWALGDCPTVACDEEACGPAPGAPNYLCDDGTTVAGPGPCEPQADGTCGWTWVVCPGDGCSDEQCGPPLGLPNYECDDGTIAGPGDCVVGPDGTCGWEIVECPA